MSPHMPRQMLGCPTPFRYWMLNVIQAYLIAWNRKYFPVRRKVTVLVDQSVRNIQQTDIGNHVCLLSWNVYPQTSIEIRPQVFFRKIIQICESQARKCIKINPL